MWIRFCLLVRLSIFSCVVTSISCLSDQCLLSSPRNYLPPRYNPSLSGCDQSHHVLTISPLWHAIWEPMSWRLQSTLRVPKQPTDPRQAHGSHCLGFSEFELGRKRPVSLHWWKPQDMKLWMFPYRMEKVVRKYEAGRSKEAGERGEGRVVGSSSKLQGFRGHPGPCTPRHPLTWKIPQHPPSWVLCLH